MIRVLLVDDHKLFRIGLRRMLQETHGLQIVGEAETGEVLTVASYERPSSNLADSLCARRNKPLPESAGG